MSDNFILENEKRIEFFIIDNSIFDYKLDGNSFMVYSLLQKMSRENSCNPSVSYIQKILGLSNKTIVKCISILEEKELVSVIRSEKEKYYDDTGNVAYKQKSNIYTLKDISFRKTFPDTSVNFSKDPCNFFQEPVEILQSNKTSFKKTIKKDIYGDKQKRKTFIPPTLEQVQEYCKERNNNVDAKYFYDFYDATDWCTNGKKMSSWKGKVITWEMNNKKWGKEEVKTDSHQQKEKYVVYCTECGTGIDASYICVTCKCRVDVKGNPQRGEHD